LTNRKHYLDNLRSIAILMLFPYHTFMIYNNWGELFYVNGPGLKAPSVFLSINWIWMMPLLFSIAGVSSRYALERRSVGEYAKNRVSKLLVPLIFGLLLLIPMQTYLASQFHNGQANYLNYFTKLTDFSGVDGSFTPGHLWFILFLFIISTLSLPFMIWYKKKGKGSLGNHVPLVVVVFMGLIPCLGNMLFELGGKSPTEYLAFFLLGYYFLSNERILERLDKYRFLLLLLAVAGAALTNVYDHVLSEAVSWLALLSVLGLGRHSLNFRSKASAYLSKSSFGVYVFHQFWLVIAAFLTFKVTDNPWVQIPAIMLSSILLTYLTYELFHHIPAFRWMFGLKK
jgi:surface polysaccharide O-acyltransferase-like enzyme